MVRCNSAATGRPLALAYGAAGFSGAGSMGSRGVPVKQMLREACQQFPGRVLMVHEFRTSRVSSAHTNVVAGHAEGFRWLRPVRSMATLSRIRGLMCSTSTGITFYDRDVSAALNIRRIAAGPGRPRELSSWLGRPAMPNPGRPGQEWGLADSGKLAQARQVAERGLSDLRGYMPVNSSHNDNIDIHLKGFTHPSPATEHPGPFHGTEVKDWAAEYADPNELSGWKNMVRSPAHNGRMLRQIPKAFFVDPDNAPITSKLVELEKTELAGDENTPGALAKQMAVDSREHYVKLGAKGARSKYGLTNEVASYSAAMEPVDPEDPDAPPAITKLTLYLQIIHAIHVNSSPAAGHSNSSNSSNKRPPTDIGSGLADKRAFQSDPATQMGMGLDSGAIQAVSAALGVWDEDGCLESFHSSKLTRRQVQHDSGLIQARRNSQLWHDNVKLELQHLAAATPAVTSLVAIQQHVDVTQAAWDAAQQKMRLYGAQEKVLERYFKKACRKVVERPNSGRPTDRVKGFVVTVDEFRTSRVSSAMNSLQPREEELDRSKPTRPEDWKP
ncbi:hypothetical protein QJQ45_004674 [Haematococcus lacustris]|nr:hypothetical protein QJQ45_004674 [Haematococcus lacustris]